MNGMKIVCQKNAGQFFDEHNRQFWRQTLPKSNYKNPDTWAQVKQGRRFKVVALVQRGGRRQDAEQKSEKEMVFPILFFPFHSNVFFLKV